MPEEDNCITKKDWIYINYRINPFLVHYSFIFMLWNFEIFRKRPPKQITVANIITSCFIHPNVYIILTFLITNNQVTFLNAILHVNKSVLLTVQ